MSFKDIRRHKTKSTRETKPNAIVATGARGSLVVWEPSVYVLIHVLRAEQPVWDGQHQHTEQHEADRFDRPEPFAGESARERIVRPACLLRPGGLLDDRPVAGPGPVGPAFVADTVEVPFVVVTDLRAVVAQHHRADGRVWRATFSVGDKRDRTEQNAAQGHEEECKADVDGPFGNEQTHGNSGLKLS